MSKPCCPHPVERHAYNGCAECGCNVLWKEHPDRHRDQSDGAKAARRYSRDRVIQALARARHDRLLDEDEESYVAKALTYPFTDPARDPEIPAAAPPTGVTS